jgi:hypothetical protein
MESIEVQRWIGVGIEFAGLITIVFLGYFVPKIAERRCDKKDPPKENC